MKASLIWPAFADLSCLDGSWLPHGVTAVATEANLRGHKVDILDGRVIPMESMKQIISTTDVEVIGVSVISAYQDYARELISYAKSQRPDLTIVVGGIHPTVTGDDLGSDILVSGEGEKVFSEILEGRREQVITASPVDLAQVSPIDRTLIRIDEEPLPGLDKPFATIIIGRGCPYKCNFCQPAEHTLFGSRLRLRPVQSVVDELVSLGVNSFMVHDDCFTSSKRYVEEFCAGLPDGLTWWCQGRADNVCNDPTLVRGMRDAGLRGMILGHESGDQRVLDSLEKGVTVQQNIESARILRALGIAVWSNIMVGTPYEPPSAVINTIAMVREMRPDILSLSVFTPHPGSHLYDFCQKMEIMPESPSQDYFNRGQFEAKIEGPDYGFLAWAASQMNGGKDEG